MPSWRTIAGLAVAGTSICYAYYYSTWSRQPPLAVLETCRTGPQSNAFGMEDVIAQHPSRLFTRDAISLDELYRKVKEAVTEYQYSRKAPLAAQVLEYHTSRVASNQPMEDRHVELAFNKDGSNDVMYIFGVIDGHAGHACAQTLKENLGQYMYDAIIRVPTPWTKENYESLTKAVEDSFLKMDDELMKVGLDESIPMSPDVIAPALSGAVTAFAALRGKTLVVGGTGDVRAVLGRRQNDNNGYEAIALTEEHHVDLPKERDRLLSEHPGEQFVIHAGRVLGGLQPSRAFGDGRYKWTVAEMEELTKRIQHIPSKGKQHGARMGSVTPPPQYFTPPYVTARPDVQIHEIDNHDHFLIMATDGLWDSLSNEKAVEVVDEYLRKRANKELDESINVASYLIEQACSQFPNGPIRDRNGNWVTPEQVAAQLLAIPPGPSRRYRDDITVTVVFFEGTKDRVPPSDAKSTSTMPVLECTKLTTWTETVRKEKSKL